MKSIYVAASAALLSMSLVACNDLDTQPQDSYVTSEEKEEAVGSNPELAAAGVVGVSTTFNQYGAVYDEHFDFGWPGVMMAFELAGADMYSFYTGYNQFLWAENYAFGTNNCVAGNMLWYYSYKVIKSANDVLANIDPETTDPQLELYASQGFANRAYSYFMLAQGFQYTYKGHESLLCVPLITPENSDAAATEGCPRATVQEVYDQCLGDISKAIKMLEDAANAGLSTSDIASVAPKRFVGLGTAYGIRARINLVMNNWQAAADDAEKAIRLSGATPFSIEEASQPTFVTQDEHNWMWCVYVDPTSRPVTTGICNWPSMMGSFANGYATQVGVWKMINKKLFNTVPVTDCRRGWWLDDKKSSSNLTAAQEAFLAQTKAVPYTQVKFGPYQGKINTTTNANDWPLMRVEEMYLIQAEGLAMAGSVPAGKTVLEQFVATYRDPSYKCNASDQAAFQEEVWRQRRIELWGEGHSYWDLLRLNKGIDRRGSGIEAVWVYNVPAPLKPMLVPSGEMEQNKQIQENNESWAKPVPVADI